MRTETQGKTAGTGKGKHADFRLLPDRRYHIFYMNGRGLVTERTLDVHSVTSGAYCTVYIRAYCHLRKEYRTFRLDRVLWCEDRTGKPPEKGEVTEDLFSVPEPKHTEGVSGASVEHAAQLSRPSGSAQERSRAKKPGCSVLLLTFITLGLFFFIRKEKGIEDIKDLYFSFRRLCIEYIGPGPFIPKGKTIEREYHPWTGSYEDKIASLYRRYTEITGEEETGYVDAYYIPADRNKDAALSWRELYYFQHKIDGDFFYQHNETALAPSGFVREGGGDCEDFALFTAGLLRFWGCTPYIGSFRHGAFEGGHAVCMIYSRYRPGVGRSWYLEKSPYTERREGYYVPVDYTQVGDLSNAVEKDWHFSGAVIPEKIYGRKW